MKHEYIKKVYFNKEITDRPLDDYDDHLGRFCAIEMKKMDHQEGRKKRIYDMLKVKNNKILENLAKQHERLTQIERVMWWEPFMRTSVCQRGNHASSGNMRFSPVF